MRGEIEGPAISLDLDDSPGCDTLMSPMNDDLADAIPRNLQNGPAVKLARQLTELDHHNYVPCLAMVKRRVGSEMNHRAHFLC